MCQVALISLIIIGLKYFGLPTLAFFNLTLAIGVGLVLAFHQPLILPAALAIWMTGLALNYLPILRGVVQAGTNRPGGSKHEVAVATEETWFREGAETWSIRQRLNSLLLFGYAHQNSLWFALWPLALWPMIAGAIFMHRYLMVYRRTSSREQALWASTRLHYVSNLSLTDRLTLALLVPALIATSVALGFA